jgi:hypothetical protein
MSGFYPPAMPTAASAAVSVDVACRKCSYNLRGMAGDGLCPECGAPVSLSMRGDLIRYSDPAWINRLSSGITLILWGVGIVIVAFALQLWNRSQFLFSPLVPRLVSLAGDLLYDAGYWALTLPDPSGLGENLYGRYRKLVRVCVCLMLVLHLWGAVARDDLFPPGIYLPIAIAAGVCRLAGCVGFIAALKYLSLLATRIRDGDLENRARIFQYTLGIPLGLVALVVCGIELKFAAGWGRARPSNGFIMAVGFTELIVLISGIRYLLVLRRYRNRLQEQAALATESWPAPSNLTE